MLAWFLVMAAYIAVVIGPLLLYDLYRHYHR